MFEVGQLVGFWGKQPPAAGGGTSYSFTDSQNFDGGTPPHTFSSASIGTAAADRLVVVCVGGTDTSDYISSMTIGGVSATQLILANDQDRGITVIYAASVTSGTTADIVMSSSAAMKESACTVYALYGYSITPYDTAKAGADGSSPATVSCTIDTSAADDLIIAFSADRSDTGGSGTTTISGVDTDYSFNWQDDPTPNRGEFVGGSYLAVGSETGRTITATFIDPIRRNIAAVTFTPS